MRIIGRNVWPLAVIVAMVVGCSPGTSQSGNQSDSGTNHSIPDAGHNTNGNQNNQFVPPADSRIYVNSRDTLYYIDPGVSDDLVTIGDFSGTCTSGSGLYDIAVDDRDTILGIAAEALYEVDKDTAVCTPVFDLPNGTPNFFSLSYVKGVDPMAPSEDRLIAASAEDGEWVLIDYPNDIIAQLLVHLGYYDPAGFSWRSSGDIVSIQIDHDAFLTYATVKCPNYGPGQCDSDWLALIEPQTGEATLIGPTGYRQIFALGYWGDRVYGFTNGGDYVTIDVVTGASTLIQQFGFGFWGAGNTTIPHIVL